MKDATITLRVPRETRARLESIAKKEGRSLSQQIERLVEQALSGSTFRTARGRGIRPLAGVLKVGHVPTLDEFRAVRTSLSAALLRRIHPGE